VPKRPPHKLTITAEGKRLRASCACGQWVRTAPDGLGAADRLKGRYVAHVTGSNQLP
jgi:hypothetical protein